MMPEGSPSGTLLRPDQRNIIYSSYIDFHFHIFIMYLRNIIYLSHIDIHVVVIIVVTYQRNCILSAVWKTLSMLKSHMGESKGKMCRSPSQFNTRWRLGENLDKSTFCVEYLIVQNTVPFSKMFKETSDGETLYDKIRFKTWEEDVNK